MTPVILQIIDEPLTTVFQPVHLIIGLEYL